MKNTHRINGLIYITSEEVITEITNVKDRYVVSEYGFVTKADRIEGRFLYHKNGGNNFIEYYKFGILSNDPALISDGIQAIDPDAEKWLNENPGCEWVDVDNRLKISSFKKGFVTDNPNYNKINLPKRQTIEEAAENESEKKCKEIINKLNILEAADLFVQNEDTYFREKTFVRHAFIQGAKSQAARDYWYNIFKSEYLTIPDIRNKLSPITLIIDLLERGEIEFAMDSVKEAKKSVNYLSNSEVYKIC